MASKRDILLAARAERLEHANQLVQVIARHGRRFFYCHTKDSVAHFSIDSGGRVLFHDDYTGKAIYTPKKGCWKSMGFSHGGTLQSLAQDIAEYISRGKLLRRWIIGPERMAGGNIWGYEQEAMAACRAEAFALPIFEAEEVTC